MWGGATEDQLNGMMDGFFHYINWPPMSLWLAMIIVLPPAHGRDSSASRIFGPCWAALRRLTGDGVALGRRGADTREFHLATWCELCGG